MLRKTDMVKAIAQKASLTNVQAEAAFEAFVGTLTETLAAGDKIQFMGLGSFEVKTRAARTSRNPKTGEPIQVPETRSVGFSAGKKLKEAVKAGGADVESEAE